MTSVATGIGVCCAVGLNMATVFAYQTPPPPNAKPPLQTSAKPTEAEITVTGCLVQGSAPAVFVLQNAKRDPQSATEKAARYIVVPAAEDLVLKQHLNHQVRILGVPDGRPQPTPQAGGTVDEKLVPALNAKSLTMVSAACGAGVLAGGGAGEPGLDSSVMSTSGLTGGRLASGPFGYYGGVGFAHTSSITGAFSQGAPAGTLSGLDEMLNWGIPTGGSEFIFSSEDASYGVEALMNHAARAAATELLGEDAPAPGRTVSAGLGVSLANPKPGTVLLIASGLLLAVYAGRRREWTAFGRRSAR